MKQVKILNQLGVILMVMTGLVLSCSGQSHDGRSTECATSVGKQQDPLKPIKHEFKFPEIPVMLQTPEERLNFLVRHYWDLFDFRDTAFIYLPDVTEQALVNYLDLLNRVPAQLVDTCMTQTLRMADCEPKMMKYFVETLRSYCMDPNSPMRNEELYYPVALFLSQKAGVDNIQHDKAEFELKKIRLNRKGTIATDFEYTLASGKKGRMHQLNKEFTLLIFYNPDCESCEEQLNYMSKSPLFTGKNFLSKVSVIAMYADLELDLWKERQQMIPDLWINAYDAKGDIMKKGKYNLEATPSFYLLDKDKRVLLKDAPIGAIEAFFTQLVM